MAGKNKGGREARKPKAESNKRVGGQTPTPGAAVGEAVTKGKR